jgi:hypothetical protein
MEMNVEKTKVMRISRQPFPIQIVLDQKQADYVEYFNCFGSMIVYDSKMYTRNYPGLSCRSGIRQEEGSFDQQIVLKFKD